MEHLRISGARYPGVPHSSGERGQKTEGQQLALPAEPQTPTIHWSFSIAQEHKVTFFVPVFPAEPQGKGVSLANHLKLPPKLVVAFLGKPSLGNGFKVLLYNIIYLPYKPSYSVIKTACLFVFRRQGFSV